MHSYQDVFEKFMLALLGLTIALGSYAIGRTDINPQKKPGELVGGELPQKATSSKRGSVRLKGEDLSVTLIRKRGDAQKEFLEGDAALRPGDEMTFKVTAAMNVKMSLGFWTVEDTWQPIVEGLDLAAGEHFLSEHTFTVDTWESIGGSILYGFVDDVKNAVEGDNWENVETIELVADKNVGSQTWDGFNVSKANIFKFGFLSEEPFDAVTMAEDPSLSVGNHVCPWNHSTYWHPNADQGAGMSWGDFDSNLGWLLEADDGLKTGAVIHLKAHCDDESCDLERPSYLHSNSKKNGGNSWGEKDAQMAWKLVYDGALTSGSKVGLQANCLPESENVACEEVKDLYLLSNAAESAGQSWGPKSGEYAWILEYEGDPTQPPGPGQPVYLKGHCTGTKSQWLPPNAVDEESTCLSTLTPEEFWNIHVDHGWVSGTPESFKVEGPENWKGDLNRLESSKYHWPIDGAFHVVAGNPTPKPNPAKYQRQFNTVSAKDIEARVKAHVQEEKCISDWMFGQLRHHVFTATAGNRIASGDNHSCRLNGHGRIDCWGDNSKGQLNVPKGYFKAVEAGANFTCALRLAGPAVCWGDGSKGQISVASGRFKNFSANGNSVCALDFDGLAHCWGDMAGAKVPDVVFAKVSTSGTHACGLDYEHQIACWGASDKGQLVVPDKEFDMVAVAQGISCGITSDKLAVDCWGDVKMSVPLDQNMGNMAIMTHADSVCLVNRWHDSSFDTYNPLFCWGSGKHMNKHPLELIGSNGADYLVGVGKDHVCSHTQGGTMCWGDNAYHQTDHVPIFDDFTIGESHICAVDEGKIQCRGDDSMGQLLPPPNPRVHNVVAGDNHNCGYSWRHLQKHADIRCWGDSSLGQTDAPKAPESLMMDNWGGKAPLISAGSNHTCAIWPNNDLKKEGAHKVLCWGDNELGQTNAPEGVYSQVVSGKNHNCAIELQTKAVTCWGDNQKGQTNAPSGQFEKLYAGGHVTCGIRPGNNNLSDLVCWGDTTHGLTKIPESPDGIPIEWWGTIHRMKANGAKRHTHLSLSETRACAIVAPGLPWANWPEDMTKLRSSFLMCWGADGVQTFGSTYGHNSVDVRDDTICVTEIGGGGYCWGYHPAALTEIPQVVDAGEHTAIVNQGIHAFRYPDNTGNTCGSCHAPDGIDLAYLQWKEGASLKRRTEGHVPDEMVDDILGMLKAHKQVYEWDPDIDGADFRPFQPATDPLEGETPAERDKAFMNGLKELELLIVIDTIDSVEKAQEARDQLLELNLMDLPIGITLPKYSMDAFRGDKEKSIVEWIPAMAFRPAAGKRGHLRDLENSYLEDPSDGNFINLLLKFADTSDPMMVPNPTFCGDMNIKRCSTSTDNIKVDGNLDGIERQRMLALMILNHEMRREMMGEESRTSAEMAAAYPLNPFWNWGALAEASGAACDAVRANIPKWMNNDDVKRECVRIPEPWHGEYTDCTNNGRCFVTPDLLAMGLPLRWLGFMAHPSLTDNQLDTHDPEPSSLAKVQALGDRLEAAGLSSHHALMLIAHRMHKFFGPNQAWKKASPFISQQGLLAEFSQVQGLGLPAGSTQDHVKDHIAMVGNIEKMLGYLAAEVKMPGDDK
jgi:hypothetical protein